MTTFADTVRAARRLELLRLLAEAPRYEANQHLLYSALPSRGIPSNADQVAIELAWLAEQDLVILSEIGIIRLARITQRGIDVAKGLAIVPGVKRPAPGE